MKKILLVGVNARYTHTCLAVRCLKAAAPNEHIDILEASINDRVDAVAERIVAARPDAAGFSCYIWNIEHVLKVASTVKKALPGCLILLGGPEVSPCGDALMETHGFIDMVVRGEGEAPFAHFAAAFAAGQPVSDTPSAFVRDGKRILTTPDAPPMDLSDLPFVYDDLSGFENKIIYYETSRGCPYRCAYCMSADQPPRFLTVDRVKNELERFFAANVKLVKLVDRTFNAPPRRAYELFTALIELSEQYPDARTGFHFEISADLIDDETIELLRTAKKGLIRLEVGIQSTHAATLQAVGRAHDTARLLAQTAKLCALDNIYVHTDLIAGLPHEGWDAFAQSFNDVYALGADHLQLGFLKVLKGAPMADMVQEYSIEYADYPPYEVVQTHAMTYGELRKLHRIEDVLERTKNAGLFEKTLAHFVPQFASPFAFYDALAAFLFARGFFDRPQSSASLFEAVCAFAQEKSAPDIIFEALCFDWMCIEKPRRWPDGLRAMQTKAQQDAVRRCFKNAEFINTYLPHYAGLSSDEIARRCGVGFFARLFGENTAVLFDYGKRRSEDGFAQRFIYTGTAG